MYSCRLYTGKEQNKHFFAFLKFREVMLCSFLICGGGGWARGDMWTNHWNKYMLCLPYWSIQDNLMFLYHDYVNVFYQSHVLVTQSKPPTYSPTALESHKSGVKSVAIFHTKWYTSINMCHHATSEATRKGAKNRENSFLVACLKQMLPCWYSTFTRPWYVFDRLQDSATVASGLSNDLSMVSRYQRASVSTSRRHCQHFVGIEGGSFANAYLYIYVFVYAFINECIHSFMHIIIHSIIFPFIYLLTHAFIIHSFIYCIC